MRPIFPRARRALRRLRRAVADGLADLAYLLDPESFVPDVSHVEPGPSVELPEYGGSPVSYSEEAERMRAEVVNDVRVQKTTEPRAPAHLVGSAAWRAARARGELP